MKSLTIATTWGPKYWPNPVKPCIESTVQNWPDHAKILFYPDDMTQQLPLDRVEYLDLCKEQPKLLEFINKHKDNPTLNPRIKQNKQEQKTPLRREAQGEASRALLRAGCAAIDACALLRSGSG